MLNWLMKFIPEEYKWSVAIKKASYAVGKLAVAGLMYGKVGSVVGSHLTPDQLAQVQLAAGGISAGLLEGLHDYLKVRFPNAAWL